MGSFLVFVLLPAILKKEMRKPVLSIQIVYMYKVTSVVLPCRST